jgi:small-conductance mechanosensitive channel
MSGETTNIPLIRTKVHRPSVGHDHVLRPHLLERLDQRFREANIEIAFPQRDLHLRSVDESVSLRPPETTR